jgi:hypothetical protein
MCENVFRVAHRNLDHKRRGVTGKLSEGESVVYWDNRREMLTKPTVFEYEIWNRCIPRS